MSFFPCDWPHRYTVPNPQYNKRAAKAAAAARAKEIAIEVDGGDPSKTSALSAGREGKTSPRSKGAPSVRTHL